MALALVVLAGLLGPLLGVGRRVPVPVLVGELIGLKGLVRSPSAMGLALAMALAATAADVIPALVVGRANDWYARKMPAKALKENWKEQPDDHDYPAAQDYLSLLVPEPEARQIVARLRAAAIVRRKAKDLLRSSRLPVLATDNFHVARDLKKVKTGRKLSPVLLVRGQLAAHVPLTIADGYHRICASYHLDEDADIPCRITDAGIRSGRQRS